MRRQPGVIHIHSEIALPFLLGLPDNALASGTQGQLGFGETLYLANHRSQYAALPLGVLCRIKDRDIRARTGKFTLMGLAWARCRNWRVVYWLYGKSKDLVWLPEKYGGLSLRERSPTY
jgi:hypothetical protein